jgi:hypothetical protein
VALVNGPFHIELMGGFAQPARHAVVGLGAELRGDASFRKFVPDDPMCNIGDGRQSRAALEPQQSLRHRQARTNSLGHCWYQADTMASWR